MQNKLREAWYIGLFDSLPLLRDPMLLVVVSLFSFLPVFFIFVFAGGDTALPALVGGIVLRRAVSRAFIAQAGELSKYVFGLVSLSGLEKAFGWADLIAFAVIMALKTIKKAHWVDP